MGKAKKRNFHNCANTGSPLSSLPLALTRSEALQKIVEAIKSADFGDETKDLITLFGITAEELAEAGVRYEDLVTLKACFI